MRATVLQVRGLLFAALIGVSCLVGACSHSKRSSDDSSGEGRSSAGGEPLGSSGTLNASSCSQLNQCPATPCPSGQGCFHLDACDTARCLPSEEVCELVCGGPNCAIAESYPMQVICETTSPPDPTAALLPSPGADACGQASLELRRETDRITRCTSDEECGQVLAGTSCGCTRDLVARIDAELAAFETRRAAVRELGCPAMGSTCDCPAADGFVCDAGHCAWNYTP